MTESSYWGTRTKKFGIEFGTFNTFLSVLRKGRIWRKAMHCISIMPKALCATGKVLMEETLHFSIWSIGFNLKRHPKSESLA